MASLKFTALLLLSISLQHYGLTSAVNTADVEGFTGGTRARDESVNVKETGDVCQDCTHIFGLLADLLSNTQIQRKMMEGVDTVCDHMPGPDAAAIFCREEVQRMLPLAVTFITNAVKPEEACKILGLCRFSDTQEPTSSCFVEEVLQAAVTSDNKPSTPLCSFCLFLIKTLEDLLPKERLEGLVMKLLEEICHTMPVPYKNQCEAMEKKMLDDILHYPTPKSICTLLHLCKGQEAAGDPCTLTTDRCRDLRTALRCGTLFYCQRFVWKTLDDGSL